MNIPVETVMKALSDRGLDVAARLIDGKMVLQTTADPEQFASLLPELRPAPPATLVIDLPTGIEPLTERQRQVLDTILALTHEQSYPPTVREIGARIGMASSSTVQAHIDTLEIKGYLEVGGGPRKLRVLCRAG